jgi:hypothetical protein
MFSIEEIEMLMQGLDAIERSAAMGDMMGDLLVGMVARDEEQKRKIEDDRAERQRQKAAAIRLQKMQINILKGKLAQIALDVQSESPFTSVSTT